LGETVKSLLAGFLTGLLCCVLGPRAHAEETASFNLLKLAGNNVRWQQPSARQGLVVTYRLVLEPFQSPGARNCRRMTSLDQLVAASGVSLQAVRGELAAAFAMWEGAANIRFHEASEGAQANVLIGAQAEPEGWAFADVFYDTASPERVKPISQSLICLNPSKRWKIGFDGDLRIYDLRYTFAHEIGHAIGLDHPSGNGQIMGYRYEEQFRALQPGDKLGAILLYGERKGDDVESVSGPVPNKAQRPSATRAITSPLH
jgi:hypothetical protein